jgi:hypothetical protein
LPSASSLDEEWLVARVEAAPGADSSQENVALPTTPGRPPVRLCGGVACEVDWTPSGTSLVIRMNPGAPSRARTFVLALGPDEALPRFPPHGIESEADLAGLRVVQAVDGFVYPSDEAPVVAFVRSATERNIYRIPVP